MARDLGPGRQLPKPPQHWPRHPQPCGPLLVRRCQRLGLPTVCCCAQRAAVPDPLLSTCGLAAVAAELLLEPDGSLSPSRASA